ncbi:MAG: hypothetical protein AAGC57_05515 [Pseudomonadota bacterium]
MSKAKQYSDLLRKMALRIKSIYPEKMKVIDRKTLTAIGYSEEYDSLYRDAKGQVTAVAEEMELGEFRTRFAEIKRFDFNDNDDMGHASEFKEERDAVVRVLNEMADRLGSMNAPSEPTVLVQPGAERLRSAKSQAAKSGGPARIFISSHFGPRFRDKIAKVIEASGNTPFDGTQPLMLEQENTFSMLFQDIRKCDAAIFLFTDYDYDVTSSLEDETEYLDQMTHQLLLEVGFCYACFPNRILLIVASEASDFVPRMIRQVPYFKILSTEMSFNEGMELLHTLQSDSWAGVAREISD